MGCHQREDLATSFSFLCSSHRTGSEFSSLRTGLVLRLDWLNIARVIHIFPAKIKSKPFHCGRKSIPICNQIIVVIIENKEQPANLQLHLPFLDWCKIPGRSDNLENPYPDGLSGVAIAAAATVPKCLLTSSLTTSPLRNCPRLIDSSHSSHSSTPDSFFFQGNISAFKNIGTYTAPSCWVRPLTHWA